MVAQLVLLFVIIFLIKKGLEAAKSPYGFRNPDRVIKSKRKPFGDLSPRSRSRLFAGAVAIICALEYTAPSTRLTGWDPRPSLTPERHIDDLLVDTAGLTYDELAKSADWLWSLGYVTEAGVRARIAEDLERARVGLALAGDDHVADNASTDFTLRRKSELFYRYQVEVQGLLSAQSDLGTLFDQPRVTGADVDHFMQERFTQAAKAIVEPLAAAHTAALDRKSAYLEREDRPKANEADPVLEEMKAEERIAWNQSYAAREAGWAVDRHRYVTQQRAQSPVAGLALPAVTGFLPVYDVATNDPWNPPVSVQSGPKPAGGFYRLLRRLGDAWIGYARVADTHITEQSCGFLVNGQDGAATLDRVCETAVPLPINYDLTAMDCGLDHSGAVPVNMLGSEGTLVSPNGCKESWIFPHLNVVYTPDSFTVYPPLPYGISADSDRSAPISEWVVTWGDVTHVLDGPAVFDWNGVSRVLPVLTLEHRVGGVAKDVKVWDDFRLETAGRDVTEALTVMANDPNLFEPISVTGLEVTGQEFVVPNMMRLGGFRLSKGGYDDRRFRALDKELRAHLSAALALSSPPRPGSKDAETDLPSDKCGSSFFARLSSQITAAQKDLSSFEIDPSKHPCESFMYLHAVLEQLERSKSPSQWSWLLQR